MECWGATLGLASNNRGVMQGNSSSKVPLQINSTTRRNTPMGSACPCGLGACVVPLPVCTVYSVPSLWPRRGRTYTIHAIHATRCGMVAGRRLTASCEMGARGRPASCLVGRSLDRKIEKPYKKVHSPVASAECVRQRKAHQSSERENKAQHFFHVYSNCGG